MKIVLLAAAIAAPSIPSVAGAQAAGSGTQQLPEVVVSATPLGAASAVAQPATVLTGERLQSRLQSTLGETLNGEPGVGSSSYGPNASRPVIRGMDGDRIRILQNGTSVLDASGTSVDHAVASEPLFLDRIEVLRGPAALMYGGSAIGGVVNAMDNRIPSQGYSGFMGTIDLRHGGASREQAQLAKLEGGNGRLMVHADAMQRRTEDLRIPGAARSRQRQAQAPQAGEIRGVLPNSWSRSNSGTLGSSLIWGNEVQGGYAGLAWSGHENRYGTVAESDVKIGMQQQRLDVAGEQREIGWLPWTKTARFKYVDSNYNHTEYAGSNPSTTFKNQGHDLRLELVQKPWGRLQGAFGIEHQQFTFSALGGEAFLPTTDNRNRAVFVYQELDLAPLKLSASLRQERQSVASHSDPNFGAGQTRTFAPRSGGLGVEYQLTLGYAAVLNLSSSQRAPTYQELFANGPHAATAIFEVGNSALGIERARGAELTLRKTAGALTGSAGIYRQQFDRFITAIDSGTVDPGSGFNIFNTQAVTARFTGIEISLKWLVAEKAPGKVEVESGFDRLRADNLTSGTPLPRITPTRYNLSLNYRGERWGSRIQLQRVRAQKRLAASELSTDGYTLLNAGASYTWRMGEQQVELYVRGENLLNQEIRNHASFLKDVAPAGARSLLLGVRLYLAK